MTIPNMKPFDPAHAGDFCTKAGDPVTIWSRELKGGYPWGGVIHREDYCEPASWTDEGKFLSGEGDPNDLMCVIPKREAREITLNDFGDFSAAGPMKDWANTTLREVMPDDISQEKARAVIEAARAVVGRWDSEAGSLFGGYVADLRDALGDDA